MMMKRFFILGLLLPLHVMAIELNYGKGTFESQFGLKGVMNFDVELDVDVLSLREPHFSLNDSLYIYGNIDIYRSKTLDNYASYANAASDTTLFGFSASDTASSMGMPVPVSFEMRGIDFSMGMGYEVFHDTQGNYFGVGLGTGVSMPFIETKNMIDNAQLFMAILETTKTEIMTYKLMPSLQGRYKIVDSIFIEGSLSYGYQYGTISNDYINGNGNFSGSVLHSDIAINYMPISSDTFWNRLVIDLGYRYNDWSVNEMDVSIMNPDFAYDFSQNFDIGFSSQFLYVGAGLRF